MSYRPITALQRGITMVESLVALVVLAVGMLGIASMYVTSLQAGRTALIRTQAVNLVNDMADRIRANGRARDAYDLQDAYAGAPDTNDCVAVAGANCTADELAEDDLARWIDAVGATLPGEPTTEVEFFAGASLSDPDRYRILVGWLEPGEQDELTYELNLHLLPVLP